MSVMYKVQLEDIKGKVKNDSKKIDEVCSESKLMEERKEGGKY